MNAGEGIRIHPVQLPGREGRIREPRHHDIDVLVDHLVVELEEILREPHVLFGHSMGGLIAYRLAQRRIAMGRLAPNALAVAAYAAPHLAAPSIAIDDVDDTELAKRLAEFGGLPHELLRRPEWLGALLAIVKDDLRLCQSHTHRPVEPLPCPIHVFGGDGDPLVTEAQLAGWRQHTSNRFSLSMLRGGHFLVTEGNPDLRDAVFATTQRAGG